jgi:hypothetical protein
LIQLDDDGQITLTFKKAQIWKLLWILKLITLLFILSFSYLVLY